MNLKTVLLLITGTVLFFSCNQSFNDQDNCVPGIDPFGSDPYGGLRSYSDCKGTEGKIQNEFPSSDECLLYQYFPNEKILYIAHKNTAMNCEPGKITAQLKIEKNSINIIEKQANSSARCNCLYDVDYELRNINADIYLVSISGPIIDGVNIPSFSSYIDLSQNTFGTLCINRGFYPWSE